MLLWSLLGLAFGAALRHLVDTPWEGRLAGIGMAILPAALVATAAAMALRPSRSAETWKARTALVLTACVILMGGLAVIGGKSPRRDAIARLDRELPGFRDAFIVSLGVFLLTAFLVGKSARRWRR